jgi:hypothetical protein
MAYLKPAWFTRTIFNKFAMATGVGNPGHVPWEIWSRLV